MAQAYVDLQKRRVKEEGEGVFSLAEASAMLEKELFGETSDSVLKKKKKKKTNKPKPTITDPIKPIMKTEEQPEACMPDVLNNCGQKTSCPAEMTQDKGLLGEVLRYFDAPQEPLKDEKIELGLNNFSSYLDECRLLGEHPKFMLNSDFISFHASAHASLCSLTHFVQGELLPALSEACVSFSVPENVTAFMNNPAVHYIKVLQMLGKLQSLKKHANLDFHVKLLESMRYLIPVEHKMTERKRKPM